MHLRKAGPEFDLLPQSMAEVGRFREHLPVGGDEILIVLKGHLLAEELLDRIIAAFCVDESLLGRLQFSTKSNLARSLTDYVSSECIWAAVDALNELRNTLAHRIGHPRSAGKRAAFVQRVVSFDRDGLASGSDAEAQLRMSIVLTLGGLLGFVHAAENTDIHVPNSHWTLKDRANEAA